MIISATSIREELAAVKSEILLPAPLTDAQLDAIATFRRTQKADQNFIHQFPFTAATIKPEAQEQIMAEARTRSDCCTPSSFEDAFERDVGGIHKALFGETFVHRVNSIAGLSKKPRAGYIHRDPYGDFGYLSRVGVLPFECISEERCARFTSEEKNLVTAAYGNNPAKSDETAKACQELRDRGILCAAPLGEVKLLLSGLGKGTLHDSSPVPPQGAHSAFFRVTADAAFHFG